MEDDSARMGDLENDLADVTVQPVTGCLHERLLQSPQLVEAPRLVKWGDQAPHLDNLVDGKDLGHNSIIRYGADRLDVDADLGTASDCACDKTVGMRNVEGDW